MNPVLLTCALCGHSFDPAQYPACDACPLVKGCQMVCCPACGYTNVDEQRSRLGRWVKNLIKGNRHEPGITAKP